MYEFKSWSPQNFSTITYKHNLPEHYQEDIIVLMVRDPLWIFSYWSVSDETKNNLIKKLGNEKFSKSILTIRIYYGNTGDTSRIHSQIDVKDSLSRYINVNSPDTTFWAELGYLTPDGDFIAVAVSNSITTPGAGISDLIDQEWLTVEESYRYFTTLTEQTAGSPFSLEKIKKIITHQLDLLPGSDPLIRREKNQGKK